MTTQTQTQTLTQTEIVKTIEDNVSLILDMLKDTKFEDTKFSNIQNELQYHISTINYNLKKCREICETEQFIILEFLINPILEKLQQIKIYKHNNDYPANGTATRELMSIYNDELSNMYKIIREHF